MKRSARPRCCRGRRRRRREKSLRPVPAIGRRKAPCVRRPVRSDRQWRDGAGPERSSSVMSTRDICNSESRSKIEGAWRCCEHRGAGRSCCAWRSGEAEGSCPSYRSYGRRRFKRSRSFSISTRQSQRPAISSGRRRRTARSSLSFPRCSSRLTSMARFGGAVWRCGGRRTRGALFYAYGKTRSRLAMRQPRGCAGRLRRTA